METDTALTAATNHIAAKLIESRGTGRNRIQQIENMISAGATEKEAQAASNLYKVLRPGLKVKRNGRIDTRDGDKTVLGLYRTIMRWTS